MCNNLGLWAFSTNPVGLCDVVPSVPVYGTSINVGELVFSGSPCDPIFPGDYLEPGFYSNNIIIFETTTSTGPVSIVSISACYGNENYCVEGTTDYNGTYNLKGIYDDNSYYSGESLSYVIYYSTINNQWCLSNSLGGSCFLFGPTGSFSYVPDLDISLFSEGSCTTTTSTINTCSTFDFESVFNCFITPTPTTTPTISPSPTPTPTPTPSDPCGGFVAEIGGLKKTPLPSSSPTPTPTPSSEVNRPCVYSGSVIFSTINEIMTCANSKKFKDCFTSLDYYSTQNIFDQSGNTLSEGFVYSTYINGIGICAVFEGLVENISGIDIVEIIELIGPLNEGSCLECVPPTLDPILECLVINSECGNVNVSPSSFINGKLSYTWKFPGLPQYTYQIYWDYLNNRWVCKEITTNLVGCHLNIDNEIPIGSISEWVYFDTSNSSTNCIEELVGFNTTLLSVPCPSPTPTPTPTPTPSPCVLYRYNITNEGSKSIKFNYNNCSESTSINIPKNSSVYICASTAPTNQSANISIQLLSPCI